MVALVDEQDFRAVRLPMVPVRVHLQRVVSESVAQPRRCAVLTVDCRCGLAAHLEALCDLLELIATSGEVFNDRLRFLLLPLYEPLEVLNELFLPAHESRLEL